ncbi:cyclic nucleotide-binding domain protein [Porphyromonas gingivalis W4087]|nr:cyclic nucleotide-binding domain protein [Porphyromonas gingivalis F0569]ERJ68825.1 cyclic nucleotide-binding domain protein [Porphyromonas gingivalis F0568]ERJ85766.1 cyclic nucleotide-binding domain protein [Porphyromonas gingivalis W4087]
MLKIFSLLFLGYVSSFLGTYGGKKNKQNASIKLRQRRDRAKGFSFHFFRLRTCFIKFAPMKQIEDISEFRSSPELVDKLYKHGILKVYKAGSVILNENAHVRSIPIVIKGVMRVIRTEEDGREILLYYIKAGESCIMSFLGGLHNETSKVKVEIEDDAEILFLPVDKVSLFMKEHPEWLNYIFRSYHKRFEELLDTVNAIAFKKMDERLLALIQKKAELVEGNTIQITHEQLANELGTARAVVSRLLKQLEESGIVRLGRNKITLM